MNITRIIVPIRESSQSSDSSAFKAMDLARATGATLELFHALDTDINPYMVRSGQGIGEFERIARDAALIRLERLATLLRRGGITVQVVVESDYPAYEAVIRRALKSDADLIVADTHRRHIAAGLLGFTDWQLLRHSPIPVLLTKGSHRYRHRSVMAAVDPQKTFNKPASLDRKILEAGATLASALGADLHVLHAYSPELKNLGNEGMSYVPIAAFNELYKVAESNARQAFAGLLSKSTVKKAHRHFVRENPQKAIPAMARKLGADIAVMGVVARTGLKRLFIGSTAERVMDDLACDVLVIKPACARSVSLRRRKARR